MLDKKTKLWLLVWASLLIGGVQTIKAGNWDETRSLKIAVVSQPKLCGTKEDRRFEFYFDLGKIEPQDSLFSYELWVDFDPEKIKIVSALYINTLSDFFDWKNYNIPEPGWLRVFAAQLGMNPVYGTRPLVAVKAEYLGDCPDSTEIKAENLIIELADSLDKKIDFSQTKATIVPSVKQTPTSFVEASFIADTASGFGADSTVEIVMNINDNGLERTDSLEIDFTLDDESFAFEDLKILSEKIEAFDSEINERDATVKCFLRSGLNDENALEIKIKRKKGGENAAELNAALTVLNKCSCATEVRGDKIYVKNFKDTTSSIVENDLENNEKVIDFYYDERREAFLTKTTRGDEIVKMAILYDIDGRVLEVKRNERASSLYFDARGLDYGLYPAKIRLNNGLEINILTIKN